MATLTVSSIKAALFPTDYTILSKPRISFSTFQKILKDAGSPAFPEAQAIWNSLVKYGVDPALALAQFRVESSYGLAGWAVRNRSWGNIRFASGSFIGYPNWEAGALNYAMLISGPLYAKNPQYNTAKKMPYRWAPSADNNNPAGYGANLVSFIDSYITEDRKVNPPKPTGVKVSTDRATTLAEAITTRVQYIQNLLNSHNMDPLSYVDHLNAISTYTEELHAIAGGPAPAATDTASTNSPTVSAPVIPVSNITTLEPAPATDATVTLDTAAEGGWQPSTVETSVPQNPTYPYPDGSDSKTADNIWSHFLVAEDAALAKAGEPHGLFQGTSRGALTYGALLNLLNDLIAQGVIPTNSLQVLLAAGYWAANQYEAYQSGIPANEQ